MTSLHRLQHDFLIDGNIFVGGTVDGRDIASDGSLLDSHTAASSGIHGISGSIVGTTDAQTLTTKTINASLNTFLNIVNANIGSGAGIDASKIHDGTVNNTEFGYLNGVTSAIQTQLDAKASSSHTHAAADVTSGTFADARIAETNVTQHQAAINHDSLTNYAANEHIDHSTVSINTGDGLTGGGTIASTRTINLNINGLAADASPVGSTDYLLAYDDSASAHKKVLIDNLLSVSHSHTASDITDFNSAADARISLQKGAANGLATLDGGGKIPSSQLDLDSVDYQGTWNANTNTPTITSSSGTKGHYYVVSVTGTTTIDGESDWQTGDWIIFNGTIWEKADHTDQVLSVAGKQGAVTLAAGDIASGTFADARIAETNVTQHEAAIDHDALTNFVANEHIDHSAVSITAGEGLTGGGTIAATRTLDLDINSLTEDISPNSDADFLVSYDVSAGSHKKVLISNIATTLPTTTKGDLIVHNGADDVRLAVGGDGYVLTANSATSSGLDWVLDQTSDMNCVQARRTTTLECTGSFVNITFDATDIENDTSVVEHHDSNTDRIYARDTGLYQISVVANFDGLLGSEPYLRLHKNGSSVIGTEYTNAIGTNNSFPMIQISITVNLTANDYVTVQIRDIGKNKATLRNDALFTMIRLKGTKGDQGPQGDGETNTASNVGTSGVGVFKQKSGTNLEFKKINAASNKISVNDDIGNDEIDIDVDETNIDHDTLTNFVANEHIDHSAVSITAGEGLTGGGTIAASRAIDLAINSLAEDISPDSSADFLVTYDASAGSHKKVLVANIATTLPTTTKGDLIVNNGSDDVRLPVGTNGYVLSANTSVTEGVEWAEITYTDMNAVQARKTQTYACTSSYVDMTFDATDVENDTSVLEHDNTNTERLKAKVTGLYMISAICNFDGLENSEPYVRIYKNGSTVVGSEYTNTIGTNNSFPLVQFSMFANLTANDYITLQIRDVGIDPSTLRSGAIFSVVKLTGARGAPGPAGGGETNTASNEGVGGVGVFFQKTGTNLEFKNINAGSSKITITNDSGNKEIDIDVDETNIDHDTLTNFVTDEHINHSSVSITAGEGLTGGGDITTSRTLDLDISSLTGDGSPDGAADYVVIWDASAGSHKKVLLDNLPTGSDSWTRSGTDVRLTNLGDDVGIGIANPAHMLEVRRVDVGTTDHVQFIVSDSLYTDPYNMGLGTNAGDAGRIIMSTEDGTHRQAAVFAADGDASASVFGVSTSSDSGSSWDPRLIIKSSGNVGIGKNDPSEQLDIVGNIAVSGTVDGRDIATDGSTLDSHVADSNKHVDHSTVSVNAGEGLSGGGTIATTRTLDLDINGLTADASPDGAADYVVTYDASATEHKKVLLNNLPGGGGSSNVLRDGVLSGRRFGQLYAYSSTSTLSGSGCLSSFTVSGASGLGTRNGYGSYLSFPSSSGAVYVHSNNLHLPRPTSGDGPSVCICFEHPSGFTITGDVRYFWGLTDQSGSTPVDSDDFAGSRVGMTLRSGQSETTYYFVTKDGTTESKQNTSISPSTNTIYKLTIQLDNGSAICKVLDINGSQLASHTFNSNLPLTSANMNVYCGVIKTGGSTKRFSLHNINVDAK